MSSTEEDATTTDTSSDPRSTESTRVPKTLYICRHGQDVYNKIQAETFEDPMAFDAPLTALGQKQSRALRRWLEKQVPDIELVVTSPLTRTLQTTTTAFGYLPPEIPRICDPRIAERCYASHDLGTSPRKLAKIFPQFDFSELDEVWWYKGEGHYKLSRDREYRECKDTYERFRRWRYHEPIFRLERRLRLFSEWLHTRPETQIAVVCHASVIKSLTGSRRTSNCGVVKIDIDELMIQPEEPRTHIEVRGLSSSSGSGFFSGLSSSDEDDYLISSDDESAYGTDYTHFEAKDQHEEYGELIIGTSRDNQEFVSDGKKAFVRARADPYASISTAKTSTKTSKTKKTKKKKKKK